MLDNGNVLVSFGQSVPDAQCPDEWADTQGDSCVKNHVQEIDTTTNEVVWEYSWWDRKFHNHEVHDADRLDDGETAIVDMGHNRVFTVDRDGAVTWEWSAREHIDEGSAFWADHVAGTEREDNDYRGPTQDWTHTNDVDQLPNGNLLVSVRNFDVVIEIDPETDDVVRVVGEPGDHEFIREQHDPQYLAEHDNIIVADSENDRVIEYDLDTGEEVWRYEGPRPTDRLAWPRDTDRLPNGNTLVVDTRKFRVLEVDEDGEVVWWHAMYDERAILYDADRLGPNESLPEESSTAPSGADLESRRYSDRLLDSLDSWLGFVFPPWVGRWGFLAIVLGLVSAVGLSWEAIRTYWLDGDDGTPGSH
jgi:outer membrane protein assembly factor BamB